MIEEKYKSNPKKNGRLEQFFDFISKKSFYIPLGIIASLGISNYVDKVLDYINLLNNPPAIIREVNEIDTALNKSYEFKLGDINKESIDVLLYESKSLKIKKNNLESKPNFDEIKSTYEQKKQQYIKGVKNDGIFALFCYLVGLPIVFSGFISDRIEKQESKN